MLDAIQWLDSALKLVKQETIKACFSKAGFTYDDAKCTNEIEKMDERIKESVKEMCLIIGDNNTNDFLMVYKKFSRKAKKFSHKILLKKIYLKTMTKKRYFTKKSYR